VSTLSLAFPKPLADKYRPATVEEFCGLEKPKKVMSRFITAPYASEWLFEGPSGTGKTSMALAICQALDGELHHIPSQSCDLATVKQVCDLCHRFPFRWDVGKPARFHVVLVDEADRMSDAAQLAFLSKLDATAKPPNTIFLFTCNSTERLEARFLSRCRRLTFSNYGMAAGIKTLLEKIWDKETDNPATESYLNSCNGITARIVYLLEVDYDLGRFSVLHHWKYSDGPLTGPLAKGVN
jgi:replication factor C subunit 2/4